MSTDVDEYDGDSNDDDGHLDHYDEDEDDEGDGDDDYDDYDYDGDGNTDDDDDGDGLDDADSCFDAPPR